jgi:serine phosphatase RsbU (regulator of sigma subunit)
MPLLHRVDVPESSLLVFYTDGVTEHAREPFKGPQNCRIYATEPLRRRAPAFKEIEADR